jgi:hypothetical protein
MFDWPHSATDPSSCITAWIKAMPHALSQSSRIDQEETVEHLLHSGHPITWSLIGALSFCSSRGPAIPTIVQRTRRRTWQVNVCYTNIGG